jgi:calcineurin-like phosphoesterase family protein
MRGFDNIEEHDNTIIDNWNSVVTKRDTVWILGDIAMNKKHYPLLDKLKGTKNVVLGNHDLPKYTRDLLNHVNHVCAGWKKKDYIFTHIPIHPNQFYRFTGNIHGHTHEKNIDDYRYINVSCEQVDYTPVLIEELISEDT